MKIAILGAGNVGRALARGWTRAGHAVMFGLRDPASAKARAVLAEIAGTSAGTVAEAAAFADVVVLATPWTATREALAAAGRLDGKVILDCTNPLAADLSRLEIGLTSSGGEQVAAWSRSPRVVKIFNTTGSANMENPRYGEERATMCYCGDDEAAKKAAAALAADLGFEPLDAGPLSEARLLEPFALLWIHLALFRKHGVGIAFQLMRR